MDQGRRSKSKQNIVSNVLQYILQLNGNFNPTFNNFNNNVQRSSNALNTLQVAAGNMLASISGRILGLSRSLFDEIYNGTVKREQDIAGLFTFVGDQAESVYRNIQKDAAVTPFNTQSLLDVNMALISAGVNAKAARTDSMNLANAISAVGKGNAELSRMAANMQQIKTVGKASAMDIKQFGMAGINIYELLHRATGKSIADVKEMDVSYDLLAKSLAMANAKGGLYDGALGRQGKTLGAMMESVKDNFSMGMADFGDMLRPLFEKGLVYLQKFMDRLPGLLEKARPYVMAIGDAFFWVIDKLIAGARWVRDLWNRFKEGEPVARMIGMFVINIGIFIAIIKLATFFTGLWEAATGALNIVMNLNPISLIIAAIVVLIALIGFVVYKTDGWGNMWQHTVKGAKLLWEWFTSTAKLAFDVMVNGFVVGLNKIKLGWYEFKNAVGLGDSNENNAMIAQINADTEARKKALAKEVYDNVKTGMDALSEFKQAGASLSWNNKGFGDFKNEIKKKLGIPGADVKTGLTGSSADGGKSGKSANSVATGGQKNVTVNLSIAHMAQGWTLKVNSLEEGLENMQERIMEVMTRGVAMGAALGGE